MHPAAMPITGAHRRRTGDPRSTNPATTTSVASAVSGAAVGSAAEASFSRPNTTDARVTERIINTVPPTTGVTMRRRSESHLEMATWNTPVTKMSVVSVAGPPSTRALMQKGMAKGAVVIGSTAPAPTNPSRRTWMNVASPTTSNEAKTIHAR